MPIKATNYEPILIPLIQDEDVQVYINRATPRMNQRRAELLKTQEYSTDGRFMRVEINPALLQMWEIFLSAGGPNGEIGQGLVLVKPDPDNEDETIEEKLFPKKHAEYTFGEFQEELYKLPLQVLSFWVAAVRTVNQSWNHPF